MSYLFLINATISILLGSFIFVRAQSVVTEAEVDVFQENIFFKFYSNNSIVYESNSNKDDLTQIEGCKKNGEWLMMVHGWTDNCSTSYMVDIIEKFTEHRGGCICCMDYYAYSQGGSSLNYVNLTSNFDPLSNVLLRKFQQFEDQGFDISLGYVYAMSFGSQLALNAGRDFGGKIPYIDALDPAGPLFYPNPTFQKRGSPRLAAKNVQCIHCSVDEGTLLYDCHQDWRMGDCGINQAAAVNIYSIPIDGALIPFTRENHLTCPLFYSSAFTHNFTAIDNKCCLSSRRAVPKCYNMGYNQKNKESVQQKDLFALTFADAPYNVPSLNSGVTFAPPSCGC